MNILVDALPTAVMIGGQEVPITTDFRDCLRVVLAYEDDELTPTEQAMILLDNLYPEPPSDIDAALRQGVKFLNCGEATEEGGDGSTLRLYGFDHDAALIFAAFRQTHGIDLASVQGLHWWAFVALFMDLGSETSFCQLVGLRKRVKTGKATPEERRIAHEMGAMFEPPEPDTRPAEQRAAEQAKEDEFMRIVLESEKRRSEERKRQKKAQS